MSALIYMGFLAEKAAFQQPEAGRIGEAGLRVGDTASLVRTLTHKDIEVFAIISGDVNPAHVDEAFAKSDMFHKVVQPMHLQLFSDAGAVRIFHVSACQPGLAAR